MKNRMGLAYEKLKQYPETISAYKKVIALEPTGHMADCVREIINELSTTQPANK